MSIFLRWGIPAFLTVVGGTAAALATTAGTIPADLSSRSVLALSDDHWAKVQFDMRDAVITGTATSQDAIDAAVARVSAIHGVRSVTTTAVVAEYASPFPFVVTVDRAGLGLSGAYPDSAAHNVLVAATPPVAIDTTRIMSGAPDREKWVAAALYALAIAQNLDEGEVALTDLDLTVSGRARDFESYTRVAGLLEQGPPSGTSLSFHQVQPALQSPFEWRAEYDGRHLTLAGSVPSEQLIAELSALAPPGATVSTSLILASGAPDDFPKSSRLLVENLLKLQSGTATISDATSTLDGTPSDPEAVESVLTAMATTGTSVSLDAPDVSDYWFSASRADGAIVLDGFVPDAAFRERLDAGGGLDTSSLEFGRGEPERFGSAVDFVLAALRRMSEGEASIRGTVVTIEGRAATLADYVALEDTLELGAPQGLLLATATVRPPMATPFTFAASKDAAGLFTLTGHVPSATARDRFAGALSTRPTDSTTIADGNPVDFEVAAIKALGVLELLDTGAVTYDGGSWSLTGTVDTPQKAFAAQSAFAAAGLRSAGWTYDVQLPPSPQVAALPVVEPYGWRAQKSAGGAIAFTGFVPTEPLKRYLVNHAGAGAVDSTALGGGAPEGFVGGAVAGLDAVLALDEGSVALVGDDWTLTGTVATTEQRYVLEAALRDAADTSEWHIAIQAADAAPVVTPFTWSATKGEDGRIAFTGYVPTEDLRRALAASAGPEPTDRTLVGSGEPGNFDASATAALAALAGLRTGEAKYDGHAWSLIGQPATAADAEAVTVALAEGDWSVALAEPVIVAEPEVTPEPEVAATPEEALTPDPAVEEQPVELAAVEPPAAMPPIERNFIFAAAKLRGGPIEFSGIVPADPMRRYLAAITDSAPSETLQIGDGLPTTFIPSAEAGTRALVKLAEGEFGLDGTTWVLTGKAETEVDRQAALAEIAAAPGIAEWQTDVTLVPPIDVCRDRIGAFATRNAILFESGSARIAETSFAAIDELAGYLAICPEASVEVEGHTDSDGEDEANLALSVSRAEAVVDALILRGIAPERLYAIGYGESLPIESNETRAGKQANRRIGFALSDRG